MQAINSQNSEANVYDEIDSPVLKRRDSSEGGYEKLYNCTSNFEQNINPILPSSLEIDPYKVPRKCNDSNDGDGYITPDRRISESATYCQAWDIDKAEEQLKTSIKRASIKPSYNISEDNDAQQAIKCEPTSEYESPWDAQLLASIQPNNHSKTTSGCSKTDSNLRFKPNSVHEETKGDPLNISKPKIGYDRYDKKIINKSDDIPRPLPKLKEQSASVTEYGSPWDISQDKIKQQTKDDEMSLNKSNYQKMTNCPKSGSNLKPAESSEYETAWDLAKNQEKFRKSIHEMHIKKINQVDRSVTDSSVRRSIDSGKTQPSYETSNRPGSDSLLTGKSLSISEETSRSPGTRNILKNAWYLISEEINPNLPLNKQRWFHKNAGRFEAESLLRVCKEGSYLVRPSESDKQSYSLSLKGSAEIINIRIDRDPSRKYILGENSRPFASIPDMIDHYTRNVLPIKGAEHMMLLYPVPTIS